LIAEYRINDGMKNGWIMSMGCMSPDENPATIVARLHGPVEAVRAADNRSFDAKFWLSSTNSDEMRGDTDPSSSRWGGNASLAYGATRSA